MCAKALASTKADDGSDVFYPNGASQLTADNKAKLVEMAKALAARPTSRRARAHARALCLLPWCPDRSVVVSTSSLLSFLLPLTYLEHLAPPLLPLAPPC